MHGDVRFMADVGSACRNLEDNTKGIENKYKEEIDCNILMKDVTLYMDVR